MRGPGRRGEQTEQQQEPAPRARTGNPREQLCTCHLQEALGAKQTLVSHHLRQLREAGLVLTEPCGRFTYYRLAPGAFDAARDALSRLCDTSGLDVPK